MQEQQEALCELWSEEQVRTKPHSRLYHLEPIGVGSPMVESLTSYITRLAEAHSVHPQALITNELVPLLNSSYFRKEGTLYQRIATFWKDSACLNGSAATASDWVQVLEQLTLIGELPFLTMLTWKDVLLPGKLLRLTRAWCPACYQEWQVNGQIVYEPLRWAIAAINSCQKHLLRLQQCCPYPDCKQTSPWLTRRARSGYCGKCNRWLGSSFSADGIKEAMFEGREWEWFQWVEKVVGELLCAPPNLLQLPQKSRFSTNLREIYEAQGSNINSLARQLQVDWKTVHQWLQGQRVPFLETLIQIGFRLEITPLCLLTENVLKIPSPQQEYSSKNFTFRTSSRRLRKIDKQSLRLYLEMELQKTEDPPPSMREVGRRLQHHPTTLWKYFPELCRAISAKYKNYLTMRRKERFQRISDEIRKAMYHLHEQGRYPSSNQVAKLLEHPCVIRQKEYRSVWLDTLRLLALRK
jgi:hypothetical protein